MSSTAEVDSGVDVLPARSSGVLVQMQLERDTIVPVIAAALILLHLGLRVWVSVGGWLFREDFLAAANLAGQAVDIPGPPGAVAIAQSVASVTPLSWSAIVGLGIAAQAMIALLLYRLLIDLFGRRPAILLPLTVYLASSLQLVGSLWWSAAVVQLPVQLALLVAVTNHVRHLRTARTRFAVTSAVAVAVGLQFSLAMALVPALLALATLMWGTSGTPRGRLRAVARLHITWASQLGAIVVGVSLRLLLSDGPRGEPADLLHAVRAVPDLLTHTVLPGLVGGPWAWTPLVPPLAVPAPPQVLLWFAAAAVAAVVLGSVLVHRGALRAWLLATAVIVVVLVLGGVSTDGQTEAYALPIDVVPPGVLALVGTVGVGLAFLPVRDAPTVLRRRKWTNSPQGVRFTGLFIRTGVGLGLVATLAIGAIVTTIDYAGYWSDNAAREFTDTARADLAGRGELVLVDDPVPEAVVPSALAPANTAATVLAGLLKPPRFLPEGEIIYQLTMLDDQGHVQLAQVEPGSSSGEGPVSDCGWPVGPEPVEIPLAHPTGDDRWIVQLSYFAAAGNTIHITAAGTTAAALIGPGLHDLYLQVVGPVDQVIVSIEDPSRPICAAHVQVGGPRPLSPAPR